MIDPIKLVLRWPANTPIAVIRNQLATLVRETGLKPLVVTEVTTDGAQVKADLLSQGVNTQDANASVPTAYATPADVTTTGSLDDGTHNVAYSDTITLVGGTAPFTILVHTVPTALVASINGRTVTLAGTHTTADTTATTISGVDANGRPWSYTRAIVFA